MRFYAFRSLLLIPHAHLGLAKAHKDKIRHFRDNLLYMAFTFCNCCEDDIDIVC